MPKVPIFCVLDENTALEQEPGALVEYKTSAVSEGAAHSLRGPFRADPIKPQDNVVASRQS